MPVFDSSMMDDGGAAAGKKAGAKSAGLTESKQIVHRAGSRGDVIEIDGKTYQPTGPLDQRGFASLTKNNPELQQAIAAKGGKHSHQGDPGVDPTRTRQYHQEDQQLNQQIQQRGGHPNDSGDDSSAAGATKGFKARVDQERMIDEVMQRKNVDRPVAERVVSRALRG